jgi:hypothetical protein
MVNEQMYRLSSWLSLAFGARQMQCLVLAIAEEELLLWVVPRNLYNMRLFSADHGLGNGFAARATTAIFLVSAIILLRSRLHLHPIPYDEIAANVGKAGRSCSIRARC